MLLAIRLPARIAHSSLRLSLERRRWLAVRISSSIGSEIIPRPQGMSPLYADFIAENK
ncbi:MAG: hypothetical protein ACLVB5_05205 [Christensenellales bacterium]